MTTSPARLAYLAGALDYNNSIRMAKRRGVLVPMISVTNTNRAHIWQLVMTFGGPMAQRANGFYVFQRSHSRAVDVVRKIRPYIRLNQKVADQILEWLPEAPKPKPQAPKVPCPNDCGRQMTPGSITCQQCYVNSVRSSHAPAVVEAVKPALMAAEPTKPLSRLSLSRMGEVMPTPTGIIHRLRG